MKRELYLATVDMLRVSDGNFNTQQILKVTLVSPTDGDMLKLKVKQLLRQILLVTIMSI